MKENFETYRVFTQRKQGHGAMILGKLILSSALQHRYRCKVYLQMV